MNFSENEFRDHLYTEYRENLSQLIVGRKDPVIWSEEGFPSVCFLLQQRSEKKINQILDSIDELVLTAKELRLKKDGDSTTRVDLFGNSIGSGLTIIELKKSKQTERQAFTELKFRTCHLSQLCEAVLILV